MAFTTGEESGVVLASDKLIRIALSADVGQVPSAAMGELP